MNRICQLLLFAALLTGLNSCEIFGPAAGYAPSPHRNTPREIRNHDTPLRESITGLAQKQLGAKYRYGGKSPGGFDCSGFVYYVMKENGISVSGYSRAQEADGHPVDLRDARPGDLVFFRKSRAGKVFHVAMVLENNDGNLTLIHSTSSRGVVIDDLTSSSYWNTKIMTARDVTGTR